MEDEESIEHSLYVAVENGDHEQVQSLLKNGARVDIPRLIEVKDSEENGDAEDEADDSEEGEGSTLKSMVDQIDLDEFETLEGIPYHVIQDVPLTVALQRGHTSVVQALVAGGCWVRDVRLQGCRSVFHVIMETLTGREDSETRTLPYHELVAMLRILLDAGMDVWARNEQGRTALEVCIRQYYDSQHALELMRSLKEASVRETLEDDDADKDADEDDLSDQDDPTAGTDNTREQQHQYQQQQQHHQYEDTDPDLNQGAGTSGDITMEQYGQVFRASDMYDFYSGEGSIINAVQTGDIDLVVCLLEMGASPFIRDAHHGHNLMTAVAEQGNQQLLEMLLGVIPGGMDTTGMAVAAAGTGRRCGEEGDDAGWRQPKYEILKMLWTRSSEGKGKTTGKNKEKEKSKGRKSNTPTPQGPPGSRDGPRPRTGADMMMPSLHRMMVRDGWEEERQQLWKEVSKGGGKGGMDVGTMMDARDGWNNTVVHGIALSKTGDRRDMMTRLASEKRMDLQCVNVYDMTPLHMAAMWGHGDVVAVLLGRPVDVDGRDGWGRTALHLAAQEGHAEVVRTLLEEGGMTEGRKGTDEGRLMDVREEGKGRTALQMAVEHEHVGCGEILISAGCDVSGYIGDNDDNDESNNDNNNDRDDIPNHHHHHPHRGTTPSRRNVVEEAAVQGWRDLLELLTHRHPSLCLVGDPPPLYRTIAQDDATLVRVMGRVPGSEDLIYDGYDAVSYACRLGSEAALRVLLELGFPTSPRRRRERYMHDDNDHDHDHDTNNNNNHNNNNNNNNNTINRTRDSDPESPKEPSQHRHHRGRSERRTRPSALHLAAREGYAEMVRMLVEEGGVPVDGEGYLMTDMSHDGGNDNNNNRCNNTNNNNNNNNDNNNNDNNSQGVPNTDGGIDPMTPLLWAAGEGHADVTRTLVDRGADVMVRDRTGMTALHRAGIRAGGTDKVAADPIVGNKDTLLTLVHDGQADIYARDHRRRTVLDVLAEHGHHTIHFNTRRY